MSCLPFATLSMCGDGCCCPSQSWSCVHRDHPTVIKRRFTSVLVVSGLSPLFVWAWRELTAVRVSFPEHSDGHIRVFIKQMLGSYSEYGIVVALVLQLSSLSVPKRGVKSSKSLQKRLKEQSLEVVLTITVMHLLSVGDE